MAMLEPTTETSLPGVVVFVHCATNARESLVDETVETHTLLCGHGMAGRLEGGKLTREKHIDFNTGREMWDWVNYVRHPRQPVWMFAHNLHWSLTLTGFWRMMETGEFRLHRPPSESVALIRDKRMRERLSRIQPGLLVTEDPPSIVIAWANAGYKLIALDLRNYWDCTLDELESKLGNAPDPCDPVKLFGPLPIAKCLRVCNIIAAAVGRLTHWHRSTGIGRFGFSIAGIALEAVRTRWRTHLIDTPETQEQRDFERRSFYAGRVEPFIAGRFHPGGWTPPPNFTQTPTLYDDPPRGPFHLIDSRSFYGALAAFEAVPVETLGGELSPHFRSDNLENLGPDCIAEVYIAAPVERFPVRINGRTYIRSGKFWTVLSGRELERALTTGSAKRMGRWLKYRTEFAFQEFALGLHGIRLQCEERGDELISGVVKQLLARLHGKFLQRIGEWIDLPERIAPQPWHLWQEIHTSPPRIDKFRSIGWDVQIQAPPTDVRHCFPAIAAFTTAAGREWLLKWIEQIGKKEVLYCATDSMIVTESGLRRAEQLGLIWPGELGGLRVVMSSNDIEIRGVNCYRIGDKMIMAGLQHRPIVTCANRHEVIEFQRLKETIRLGGGDSIRLRKVMKEFPGWSTTGEVSPGGWITPPQHFDRS
jgi:hypothetical protein